MNEIESLIFSAGDKRRKVQGAKTRKTANAAKEILKNGILVETSKGLVCMSLKDALSKGIGGHNLSVEDFQAVATELLFQEEPKHLLVPDGASVRTKDFTAKKGHKLIKKSKMTVNKVDGVPLVPDIDTCNSAQVNLEEVKVIQESLLGDSSLENFLDKLETELGENKKMTENEETMSTLDEVTDKKPLTIRRSLIIKNNIKPVISVQKVGFNKSKGKSEMLNLGSVLKSKGSAMSGTKETDTVFCVSEGMDISCEETSDNSEVTSLATDKAENKPVKKRGGWPKGRKRKPEVKYEIRPPKAPATGYVIFLNEKRKDYRDMPFTEVTKLLGNEWSKLSLPEKKVYLDQAEVEKKRYREELKVYRQSDAYQSYLHKKRLKRLQGNGTEESDMDATDEIDEEDNEELYCRSCDQWFHSLHNKKEHLYGRQHLQSIAGRHSKMSASDWCNANMSSTSLDESSLDGSSYLKANKEHCCTKDKDSLNMDDAIVRFMAANREREEERRMLRSKLEESRGRNRALNQELQQLNERVDSLTCMTESERTAQILLEQRLFNLLNVPTLFYLPEPLNEDNN